MAYEREQKSISLNEDFLTNACFCERVSLVMDPEIPEISRENPAFQMLGIPAPA